MNYSPSPWCTRGQVGLNQFKPGTPIQIKVNNNSGRELFVAVLSIGDAGKLRVLFPYLDASEDRARVVNQQELTLPENRVVFPPGAPGLLEIMVLASDKPIYDALKALKAIRTRDGVSSSRAISATPMSGEDSLDAMSALLGDLNRNTRSDVLVARDVQAVDAKRYSVISTLIEVVK